MSAERGLQRGDLCRRGRCIIVFYFPYFVNIVFLFINETEYGTEPLLFMHDTESIDESCNMCL